MWNHVRTVLVWLFHHRPSAAISAAIAAFFSALSSFLIWRVQRRNLLESVRPELVLEGWTREPNALRFRSIKNYGRGTAFNPWFYGFRGTAEQPRGVRSVGQLTVIPSNEAIDVADGTISIWFTNTEPDLFKIDLHVISSDSRGNEYNSRYDLTVWHLNRTVTLETIAPNVTARRYTTMRPAWRNTLRFWVALRIQIAWLWLKGSK
jgi:hypothetical protein